MSTAKGSPQVVLRMRAQFDMNMDEAELVRDSLEFWQKRLNDNANYSNAHAAAGRNVFRKCERLINRLDIFISGLTP